VFASDRLGLKEMFWLAYPLVTVGAFLYIEGISAASKPSQ